MSRIVAMTLVMRNTAKDQNQAIAVAPIQIPVFPAQAPGLIIITGFAQEQAHHAITVVLGLIKRISALRLIPVILEKLV